MNQAAGALRGAISSASGDSGAAGIGGLLWLWRWKVVCSVVVCTMVAAVLAFVVTPVYKANVLLAPTAAERSGTMSSALGQLGGLASMVGVNLKSGDAQTQEAIAILNSREFTLAFIQTNNLMPALFRRKWDPHSQRWRGSPDRWPTPNKAYKLFNEKVREVSVDTHTGFVTLSIEWPNRDEAAQWANELVAQLNASTRARAIAQAESDIAYLEQELQSTKLMEVRNAINDLIEQEVRQEMVASATPEYSFRVLDKAVAADKDNPFRPRKGLTILAGLMAGLFIPFLLALLVVSRTSAGETARYQ